MSARVTGKLVNRRPQRSEIVDITPQEAHVKLLQRVRPKVFISYSHVEKDIRWVKELRERIPYYEADIAVDVDIKVGDWQAQIVKWIREADVVLLMVSNGFLSSSFINDVELPEIFRQWEAKRLDVLWMRLEHCLDDLHPIRKFQALHDPREPLAALSTDAEIFNERLVRIARIVVDVARQRRESMDESRGKSRR